MQEVIEWFPKRKLNKQSRWRSIAECIKREKRMQGQKWAERKCPTDLGH